MLKIIGASFTILGGLLLGLKMKKDIKDECVFTENLISGLIALKEEIRFVPDVLKNSILKCSETAGCAKELFLDVYNRIESGSSAEEAWETAVCELKNEEVRTVLSETGRQIGKSDTDGQISLLEIAISKLSRIYDKRLEHLTISANQYPKFGAVSGILIAVLLI